MKIRLLSTVSALAAAILVGLVFRRLDITKQTQYRSWTRQRVAAKASPIQSGLENGIRRRMALAEGLVTYVSIRPDLNQKEFEAFARMLIAGDTVVAGVNLARNNAISHVQPLAGNEKAIGFEILQDDVQRGPAEKAIVTRKPVIAGPVKLVQGGFSFIGRLPVFLPPKKAGENETYWGLAAVLIKQDGLFREAGLPADSGVVRYALRGKDGRGAKGGVFFGKEDLFKSRPVLLDMALPNGSWQMAAVPAGGWLKTAPGSWKFRTFGVLVSIVIGVLVFFFIEGWFPRSGTKLVKAG